MTSLDWSDSGEGVGELLVDGRSVAVYDYSNRKNHPYFEGVRPLQHRGVLTNTAPWDHRWHHGLWWSWKFIDDVLYWEDHPDYGNGKGALGRSYVTEHRVEQSEAGVVVIERIEWRPDGSSRADLVEERRMTVHADLDGLVGWAIDWDSAWTAQRAVTLSVTEYPEHWWGGYAGLNYRAARSMAAGETILSSGDRTGREAVHSEVGSWAALLGNVDGSGADSPDEPAFGGIALLVHPDNPPTPMYVFTAEDEFGFLATAPLMHEPRSLGEGETLRLRHRSVILGSHVGHGDLERLHRQYGGEEPSNR